MGVLGLNTSRNTISRPYNIGLPFKFNMVASKPEVPISQQLDKISEKFQGLSGVFGLNISRNTVSCLVAEVWLLSAWQSPCWIWKVTQCCTAYIWCSLKYWVKNPFYALEFSDILSNCWDMSTSGLAAAMLNLKGNPMMYSLYNVFPRVFSPKPHLSVLIFQIWPSCQVIGTSGLAFIVKDRKWNNFWFTIR